MSDRLRKFFGNRKGQHEEGSGQSAPQPAAGRPWAGRRDLPQNIGRYQVVREVGRGGAGVVYLAHDPFINRQVAIKTAKLRAQENLTEEEQRIFFTEARAAGSLEHPNIVSLYDITMEDEQYYLIMEYVDGTTLAPYIARGNLLPIDKAVRIIYTVAEALDFTHERGIVHGDIKPSNILISGSGEIKISDFGSALLSYGDGFSEAAGDTLSVLYSSPERIQGESITPQSDIFSLGIVLYELITGAKPFMADTEVGAVFQITQEDPAPMRNYRQDIPESLENIILKALAKAPSDRYASGQELASELGATFGHIFHVDQEINFQDKYNAVKKISFFKDFSSSELIDVLKATEWVHYPPGAVIIREGDHDDALYIILSGEVQVVKEERRLDRLTRGACFGEMAYLGKTTRTATIKAIRTTALMKITPSFIESTSAITQLRFARVFIATLVHRLARTSDLFAKVISQK